MFVVLKDIARSVAISYVDITIGRYRCIRGRELGPDAIRTGCVRFRLLRIAEPEDLFSLEGGFHHDATLHVAEIKELFVVLQADQQPMRSISEFLTP